MKKVKTTPETRERTLAVETLERDLFTAKPDPRDKRWKKSCAYCWLFLRHHYHYDHAYKHRMCPSCNAEKAKEVREQVEDKAKPEVCPPGIKRPKPRERGKLNQVIVSGKNPRPLENVKWSTLKEWAERLRDRFERRGQFLTVGGLVNMAYHATPNYDKGSKAAGRLKDLYRKEWSQWVDGVKVQIDAAIRREREAEEKRRRLLEEKQRPQLGSALSKQEQKVLDALGRFGQTKAEIRTASGLRKVVKPLRRLVQLGLAVKSGGEYLLPRKKKSKKKGGKVRR